MGSLLSSISGQFAKGAVLGAMFPFIIVAGLNMIFVAPLVSFGPAVQERLKRVVLGEGVWSVAAFTFIVVVATGILSQLNTPIIRLFEGYPWEQSWIGQWRADRWRRQRRVGAPLRLALRFLGRSLRQRNPADARIAKARDARTTLATLLNGTLPDEENLVLPTRLGNVIRSFERYPTVAYGIDGIALWPRLIAKIDAGFATAIDDARISFDFMINCALLCALSALSVVILWAVDKHAVLSGPSLAWAWRTLLFMVLSVVFYEWAIGAAIRWGMQVRAAFDLYRLDTLKALGYNTPPKTPADERALWEKISLAFLFPDTNRIPTREAAESMVVVSPSDLPVTVTRALMARPGGGYDVAVILENADGLGRSTTDLSLFEKIPAGFTLIPGSVSCSQPVTILGLNPLEISLSGLPAGTECRVCYSLRV